MAGSARGPVKCEGDEIVKRGEAAEGGECSCTPWPVREKSMLGNGLEGGGLSIGVDVSDKAGKENSPIFLSRCCWCVGFSARSAE